MGDLLGRYAQIERVEKTTRLTERGELIKELALKTGLSEGFIRFRTKGMQTPQDLRFILSSMKNTKGVDDKHRFNIVMFQPKVTDVSPQ